MKKHITCSNETQTAQLGRSLGKILKPGHVLGLAGPLGAGKTFLIQAMAEGMGIPQDSYVRSPTFSLLHTYYGPIPIHHVDFYRIDNVNDIEGMGFRDLFDEKSVVAIEWFDKFRHVMPADYLEIIIEPVDSARSILFISHGTEWDELLRKAL